MPKAKHVAPKKKDIVADFAKLFTEYPIIGALNMENMPAPQLAKMRKELRGKVIIRMTKKRLLKLAIAKIKDKKKGIEQFEAHLKGMPALLFTRDNPFSLYKTIKKSKSKAPAKAGQIAPYDLIVKAGPTSFAPGPIIGELGSLGLKTMVQDGKIVIREDGVIVKQGQVISPKASSMLLRLGIEPMDVGLDLVAVYEDGLMYTKDVLGIDETAFNAKLSKACSSALNLAVASCYPTKESLRILLQRAEQQARTLGIDHAILAKGITEEILATAERQAQSVQRQANLS